MRAAWYERNGPAREVLSVGEMPAPEPGPGEVRVRVHASGVNPSDWKSRAGTARPMAFPRVIPHSDGAGVIDRAGPGIPTRRVGERVWIWNAQWKRPFGTAAEFVILPAAMAVRLPEGIGFEEGACLGIPALTAHRAVTSDGPVAGQTVLVSGGAGAVARYAIQIAKLLGAGQVIATVSSAAKADDRAQGRRRPDDRLQEPNRSPTRCSRRPAAAASTASSRWTLPATPRSCRRSSRRTAFASRMAPVRRKSPSVSAR